MPAFSSRCFLLVAGMLAGVVGCSRDDTPRVARSAQLGPERTVRPGPSVAFDSNGPRSESAGRMSAPRSAGDSGSSHTAALAAGPGKGEGLEYEATTRTVKFELVGGPAGFQFNGYANGGATLRLPSKADVVMTFVNKDGTPHSAEVISGDGPLPNAGTSSAIPRAYTRNLLQGLAQEESDIMRFTVPQSGTYRIICGVPGHALSGMWIWLKLSPEAKAPSFGPTN